MVKIDYAGDVLTIYVVDHPELLSGRHSLILTELGFEKDVRSKAYILDETAGLGSKVEQLVEYFRRKRIPVESSDAIDSLQENHLQEEEDFAKAIEAGARVKQESAEVQDLQVPGFQRTLKPYQVKAVRHLLSVENGANFSVPGSGKTTMLYAAFAYRRARGDVDKLLAIGPPSSFMAWEQEYEGCFGRVPISYRLLGPDRFKRYLNPDRGEVFLTSFQTAALDVEYIIQLMKKHKFMLIIDESHYIKRFENGMWANAMLRIAPFARYRAISSGTPMPNGFLDLYSQMTVLWPGKQMLGERQKFKYQVSQDNVEDIKQRVYPFFYRIKKSDLNLPATQYHIVDLPMSPYQREIYNVLAASTIGELEQLTSRELAEVRRWRKAKIIRLMQTSSNPSLLSSFSEEFQIPPLIPSADIIDLIENYPRYEKPNKLTHTVQLANELLQGGNKVLVWTTFVRNIHLLKADLERVGVQVYTVFGGVPKDDAESVDFNREQQIHGFVRSAKPCVLIANPAALAESVSLHLACHHAIYMDRSFNCAHYLQSMDRIHRIGLADDVETHYWFLQSTDSVDEVIHKRLGEKAETMLNLLESDDLVAGSYDLDTDDWIDDSEIGRDFDAVLAHLRSLR